MSSQHKPLSSQVIVITGATSRIGLTTARMAARQGATLVLAASNVSILDRLASEIRQAGGEVHAVPVDVAVKEQVAALGDAAMARFGRVDTWINAGMALEEQDDVKPAQVAARLFSSHYWGATHGGTVAFDLLKQDGGAIINLDCHSSARHGVKGATDTLRATVEADGAPVSVTLVHAVCCGAKNAPQLVAAAILYAAGHATRETLVDDAAPARAPRLVPRLLAQCMTSIGLAPRLQASRLY